MKRAERPDRSRFELRSWTEDSLEREDYLFACYTSDGKHESDVWSSVAQNWPSRRISDCLKWELRREFAGCKLPPFCSVPLLGSHENSTVDSAPSPSNIAPLDEIQAPHSSAVTLSGCTGGGPSAGMRGGWFNIDLTEATELTTQRFHNWLVDTKACLRRNGDSMPFRARSSRSRSVRRPRAAAAPDGKPAAWLPARRPAV